MCLLAGTTTNIGVTYALVNVFELGVMGAGLGTAAAHGVSFILSSLLLTRLVSFKEVLMPVCLGESGEVLA